MIAEIKVDGMLSLIAESKTESYAIKRWYESFLLGDRSPDVWGISIGDPAYFQAMQDAVELKP